MPSKVSAQRNHATAVQKAFDFSVTTCYAISALKDHLSRVEGGHEALVAPYYYAAGQNSVAYLRKNIAEFELNLSSYLLIGIFSFFESFVKAILEELIEFHGGIDKMVQKAEARDKRFVSAIAMQTAIDRSRLRQQRNPGHRERYIKFTKALQAQGYRFPTETFSSYGVRKMGEDLSK